jgi:hypothetical protein
MRFPQPVRQPPSASVLTVLEEPDQGSGADEGVRPTVSCLANF